MEQFLSLGSGFLGHLSVGFAEFLPQLGDRGAKIPHENQALGAHGLDLFSQANHVFGQLAHGNLLS
jgi:hypothetical protein